MLKQEAAGPGSDTRIALDNLEVIRYIEALNLGLGWLGEGRPLNEYLIRALHSQLLEGTRGENRNPGSYRTRQVLIGSEGDDASAARFVPPPPLNVPTLMGNLVEFVTPPASYAPLVATAVAHYQFETIHPFEDGNGRMGRLLIPIWLIGFGVMGRPLLYLSDYFDAQREEYFDRLKGVSCRGEWQAWLEFFLEAVRSTAVDAVQRVQRITDMHGRFRGQVLASSRSQAPLAALDLVMERVFVTASEIEKYAHCSSPTAREALKTLTSLGIVKPMGGYPARWYSPELIAQAYEA